MVWRLHAALFGIYYYFCYIELTVVRYIVLHSLIFGDVDDAGDVIEMKRSSLLKVPSHQIRLG
jgi:hypothetical protein